MRVEQFEHVVEVARQGSFRRAAEELHLSQPAVSESVRNLERELGVELLERRRAGARLSADGRALLPHMLAAIEAIDRVRSAARGRQLDGRTVRIGTVTAATAPLLSPTIRGFRDAYPATHVEVVTARQASIYRGLAEGTMDLGLVNYLEDEEPPAEVETTELLRGHPVVCIRADSRLASLRRVGAAELAREPLIAMRSGYVMHRYLHRLLAGHSPTFSFSADGAEMGKLMVASGLGAAVLPEYSVVGDPLERRGEVTYREIDGDATNVLLVLHRRRGAPTSPVVRELHELFVAHARRLTEASSEPAGLPPSATR